MYDLIIVGAGPAGISSAIYAKRSGLKTLIIEKGAFGGLVNNTNVVENYPGFKTISGPDLAMEFYMHLKEVNIETAKDEVLKIIPGDIKTIITKKAEYQAKTVIIAVGRKPKKLNLENEDKLLGHGISYCAICDGPLYKDKIVGVIGAGNSAFEEGIYLSKFAKYVIILNRGKELHAQNVLQNKAFNAENIRVINECTITEIKGDDKLNSVIINNDEELQLDGLFIYVGYEPATDFINDLKITDTKGYIEVNNKYETKLSGIYAVGDVNKKNIYQIVTAVSEGATAAVNAYNKVNE